MGRVPPYVDDLEELIESKQMQLLYIKRRAFVLRAFLTELTAATKGKRFKIWNDLLWTMLNDSRDMLFVTLSDWSKAQCVSGGFFGKLQAAHLKRYARKRRVPSETEAQSELLQPEHDVAYRELFPNAGDVVKPADIVALKDRLAAATHGLHDHRDQVAHRYQSAVRKDASVKMLSIDEALAAIDVCDEIYNKLRSLAGYAWLATDVPPAQASTVTFAHDLVDELVLHPMLQERRHERESLYAELHRRHTNLQVLFNVRSLHPSEIEAEDLR